MDVSDKQRVLAVASSGGHWVQLRRLAPAFEGQDVAYLTTDAGHRAEVGAGAVLRRERRQPLEQARARSVRAEDPLGAAARASDGRGLDRRGPRLPGDPLRAAARRAHDLDRQRRQRRGALDVRTDGKRHGRPVPDAVAAPRRRPRPLPRGRAVIFVTVGTQLAFDRLIMAVDEWAGTCGNPRSSRRSARARCDLATSSTRSSSRRRSAASGCSPRRRSWLTPAWERS